MAGGRSGDCQEGGEGREDDKDTASVSPLRRETDAEDVVLTDDDTAAAGGGVV